MLLPDPFLFPRLSTQRLELRQLTDEDAAFIYSLRSNSIVNKYLQRVPCNSIEEATAFIHKIQKNISANDSFYWLIVLKNENKPVGTIALFQFSPEEKSAEIGYELHPQYHGNGIMMEAMSEVMQYVFNNTGLKKLYGYTHSLNAASIKLLEKNAFKRDLAEEMRKQNDELENMIIYSLTRPGG